jgi:hypothetical protein
VYSPEEHDYLARDDNLPPPEVLAAEIVEDLQASLAISRLWRSRWVAATAELPAERIIAEPGQNPRP